MSVQHTKNSHCVLVPLVNVNRVDGHGNVADRAGQNPQNHNQFEHDVVVEINVHLL